VGIRQSRRGLFLGQAARTSFTSEHPKACGAGAEGTARDHDHRPPSRQCDRLVERPAAAANLRPRCPACAACSARVPLDAVEAVLSSDTFEAMGVMNTVAVENEEVLGAALAIVQTEIRRIDETCSRFKPDSELSRLNRCGRKTPISPLLEDALAAALRAAEMTGGLVDPTVGARVEEIGYSLTFGAVPQDGPPVDLRVRQLRGWQSIELDPSAHTVRLHEGTSLDLGASGKAWAADRAARAASEALGIGVLVECGGDVAVHGLGPKCGWPVRVASDVGAQHGQDVVIHDGGLATSGTTSRRWRRGGVELHDIIDPSTGLPVQTPWEMVSVAGATCLEANAASTAALIMGERALAWLGALGLPSRLVRPGGGVSYTGGWAGWAGWAGR
jgi:thiamine biosynthesis lipoprotein ApbE